MNALVAKWQDLQTREQQLVLVMSVFIGIFILYSLVWQPLTNGVVEKQAKLDRQHQLLSWVQENTAVYKATNQSGASNRGGSISSTVNRTVKQRNITVTRMQPQGDELQVTIDSVPFNSLMDWLQGLSSQHGIKVKSIDMAKTDDKGVVKIRRLLLGKV